MTESPTFQSTIMSLIEDVADGDAPRDSAALDRFVAVYGPPITNHLARRFRLHPEDAAELLNEFMIAKILEPGAGGNLAERYLQRRREVGAFSFRRYLLRTVVNFAFDRFRRTKKGPVELDAIDGYDPTGRDEIVADDFEAEWAANLLNEAINQVRSECLERGQERHWQVFHARVLEPFFLGAEQPELVEIARRFSLNDAKMAANMLVTMRSKFRKQVRQLVTNYLPHGDVATEFLDEELDDLRRIASSLNYAVKISDHEVNEPLSLWEVVADEQASFQPRDLEQLWTDLQRRRVDDLVREVAPQLSTMFADVSVWGGHPLDTLTDLWVHPRPPEVLLQAIKRFAKTSGRDAARSPYPVEICVTLYHASIATAWLRHETRITRDGPKTLLQRLPHVLDYPWLDAVTRELLESWDKKLMECES